jgi:hypothetical protein
MGTTTGIQPIGTYTAPATASVALNTFLALIPDLDNPTHSGSIAGGGFLDEMSPAAAVQLRVEILAMITAFGTYVAP